MSTHFNRRELFAALAGTTLAAQQNKKVPIKKFEYLGLIRPDEEGPRPCFRINGNIVTPHPQAWATGYGYIRGDDTTVYTLGHDEAERPTREAWGRYVQDTAEYLKDAPYDRHVMPYWWNSGGDGIRLETAPEKPLNINIASIEFSGRGTTAEGKKSVLFAVKTPAGEAYQYNIDEFKFSNFRMRALGRDCADTTKFDCVTFSKAAEAQAHKADTAAAEAARPAKDRKYTLPKSVDELLARLKQPVRELNGPP